MRRTALALVALLCACGPSAPKSPWERVELPVSVTGNLHSVHGTSAQNVWAVGDSGLILHFDGTSWTRVTSGVVGKLHSVFAASDSEVWVLGDSTLLRGNATALSPVTLPKPLTSGRLVYGTKPTDVWLSTTSTTWHFDGTNWTELGVGDSRTAVTAFSGNAASGLWMLVDNKVYRGMDGSASLVEMGTGGRWKSIVAASATDAWLVGDGQQLPRYNGSAWSLVDLPESSSVYLGLNAGWAQGSNDVFFVGSQGRIVHYDGSGMTLEAEGTYDTAAPTLNAVWGASTGERWTVGADGWLLRRSAKP